MDLQQMRYVISVAEERSFTRAAAKNFVVQSALSHQIKSLERELGVALFARTSRRVDLTPAGEAFVKHAGLALSSADRAASTAAAADGNVRGTLTLGLIPTVTAVDIPAALAKFRSLYPDVRVRIHSGGSDEFMTSIAKGQMDIAILGLADDAPLASVASRVLSRDRLVAVLSERHRLAKRKRLQLSDLADEAFVDFPEGTPGRIQSDLAFKAANVPRDVAFEASTTDLMLNLVRHELAVGILAAPIAEAEEGISTVALTDGPTRVEYLAWDEFNPSPAAQAFLEVVTSSTEESTLDG